MRAYSAKMWNAIFNYFEFCISCNCTIALNMFHGISQRLRIDGETAGAEAISNPVENL